MQAPDLFRHPAALLLILALGLCHLPAQPPASLDALYTEAFLALSDGNHLLDAGKPRQALEKYRESQMLYLDLRGRDPEFKANTVTYRLEVLEEKLAAMAPKPTPSPAPSGGDSPPPEQPADPEDYQALYLQAREKLAQEAARLARLEARMIDADTRLKENQTRLSAQTVHLRELRDELSRRKSESATRLEALETESRDFARFNELLKERADTVEAENRELKRKIAGLAEDLDTTEKARDALEESHGTLQSELAEEKMNATQGEQRLILERNQLRDDLAEANRLLELEKKQLQEVQAKTKDLPLLEETVIELNTRNEELKTRVRTLEAENATATGQVADITREKDTLTETLEPLKTKLAAASERVREVEARAEALQAEREDHAKRLSTLETRLGEAQNRLGTTGVALEESRSNTETLEKRLKQIQAEREKLQGELAKARKTGSGAEAKLAKAEEAHWEYRDRLKTLETEKRDLARQAADLEKIRDRLAANVSELEEQMAAQVEKETSGKSQTKELTVLRAERAGLKEQVDILTTERDRLQLNLRQEREGRQQLKKTVDQQLDAITERMNEIIALRAKLDKAEKELKRTRAN